MIAISGPKTMDLTEDSDYYVLWQAGNDFADKHVLDYTELNRPYTHPPFAAFVYQLLSLLPLHASALVFFLLNSLILLPLAVYLIYRILINAGVNKKKAEITLILVTLLTLKYFWNNLIFIQLNFLLFIIILFGFYYLSKGKPYLAGILFTLITFIKIVPIFLAAYVFLFYFSRRVVISMLLTLLLIATVPAAFRGLELWVDDHVAYTEGFLTNYIVEGEIITFHPNHNLKAGILRTFHPETRTDESVYPGDYPVTTSIVSILLYILLGVLIVNGIVLYRRKTSFSLAYVASILLFTHLYSSLTWTAHLVTMMFILTPVILIDVKRLNRPGKIAYYLFILLMVFFGIEGSDTFGEMIYRALLDYGVYTYLLLGLFLFTSWLVWSKRSENLYPEGILI
jgi:hypothetical protein